MASGIKEGPPPGRIWAIKSDYEIRYYTTPETLAQAVVDGYDGEIVSYRLDPEPKYPTTVNHGVMVSGYPMPTPAFDLLEYKKYEKDHSAWRKRARKRVVGALADG